MRSTYVVVVAKAGHTIPPELARRLDTDRPDLVFEPTSETTWCNPTGRVIVRAWQRANPAFGIESHWSRAEGRLTTFVGHVWTKDGWSPAGVATDELAHRCRTGSVAEHVEGLAGMYSLVNLDSDGAGQIFSDPLGLSLVYTGETADVTVYASRADAVAWVITPANERPARDPMGVAWLAYAGHLVGERTGFAGVRVVPQGSYVEVRPDRGATLRTWTPAPWRPVASVDSPDELIEPVRQDIGANVRVLATMPADETLVDLTGGRDTRLVLAVLLSEGLSKRVTFRTYGQEDIPDIPIARELAEHFGLEHRSGVHRGIRGSAESRSRSFLHLTSGMVSIWDGADRRAADSALSISGLCGEIMSTHFAGTWDVRSRASLERCFSTRWGFGSRGLLRPELHAALMQEARESLYDDPVGGASPLDLIDVFFLRHRLRRWTGTIAESDLSNSTFPLYTLTGLRAAFAIGGPLRRSEYLHRRVMLATCPELVDWRFAGAGWPKPVTQRKRIRAAISREVKRRSSGTGAFRRKPTADEPTTATQRYRRATLGESHRVLDGALADPSNPVFDLLDRERTLAALTCLERLDLRDKHRLFGAATAAMWLGR
jgi:hypothetical protein